MEAAYVLRRDIVMLDIGMPQLNGSDAMKMSLRPCTKTRT